MGDIGNGAAPATGEPHEEPQEARGSFKRAVDEQEVEDLGVRPRGLVESPCNKRPRLQSPNGASRGRANTDEETAATEAQSDPCQEDTARPSIDTKSTSKPNGVTGSNGLSSPLTLPGSGTKPQLDGHDLEIPDMPHDILGLGVAAREKKLRTIFLTWSEQLLAMNTNIPAKDLLTEKASELFLGSLGGGADMPSKILRDARRAVRKVLKKELGVFGATKMSQEASTESPESSDAPTKQSDATENGNATKTQQSGLAESQHEFDGKETARDIAMDEEELQTYFPGLALDAVFCAFCAAQTHTRSDCPEMCCRYCKGLSHGRVACQKKSASKSNGTRCAFCESPGHTEVKCRAVWRTFRPDPNKLKKIKPFAAQYCYLCGQEGHYGPECGRGQKGSDSSQCETWSRNNLDRYVDADSEDMALSSKMPPGAVLGSKPADQRPKFGGRSIVPRRHVVFEDGEDEEDEGFIRPPARRKEGPGQIKFGGGKSYYRPSNQNRRNGPPQSPGRQQQANQQSRTGQGKSKKRRGNQS